MNKLQNMTCCAAAASILTACVESPATPETDFSYNTATINASSYTDTVYYDLNTASVVTVNDEWDVSFKRTSISLNQGKLSAIADGQSEKFDNDNAPIADAIVNATAATELGDFQETNAIEANYISSDIIAAIQASDLYTYNGSMPPYDDHGFSAQSNNWYYLTSAEGDSYAQMNVSSFDKSNDMAPYAYVASIDFYVETVDGFPLTSTHTWTLDFGSSAISCFDFDSGSVVSCDTSTWDVKADIVSAGQNSSYNIYLNGGASGEGSAEIIGPTTSNAYASANPAKTPGLSFAYASDIAGSAFANSAWYAYDVLNESTHYLWPNFITYVVDTDASSDSDEPYKIQILNYYNNQNASGFYTLRFTELTNTGE